MATQLTARYVTASDVLSRLRPEVNLQDIHIVMQACVTRHESWVDVCLSSLYVVPITGTEALSTVRGIVADLTAADLLTIVDQLDSGSPIDVERYPDSLRRRANAALEQLRLGQVELSDAQKLAVGAQQRRVTDGYSALDTAAQDALAPVFTRTMLRNPL